MPKVLITEPEVRLNSDQLAHLKTIAEVVMPAAWDEDSLLAAVRGAEVIAHSFFPTISARLIEASDVLRATVKYGVGVDNVDIEAATRRGVMVVNCPEYGSETVADHAFALLIALARKIVAIDRATKETSWVWPAPEFIGVDLYAKTVGLIGMGRIGRAMCRRCAGFSMERLYYDPYVRQESVAGYGAAPVALEELLGRSDFVSIHCVLTPETRGLIGAAQLRAMKESAYLIDVSRGAIIVEADLVRALREGWIAGAGIDVFADEPLTADNALLRLGGDNLLLTSHLAWYTVEADARLAQECMDRLLEVLGGKLPRNVVNAEALGLA